MKATISTREARTCFPKESPIYFEFKLNKNDVIALQQIKDRDYYRRYMNSGKKIFLIGVNFDQEAGQIDSWTYETV